ncbi:hypothetical protein [Aurantiacibacter luteus]|uniref:Uncharacterized protein n=1 Tax=Aurantiacibacter luteus TaxID=1581420 RepID=A0A0G9MW58_9SPHN|nr:hypothetical protein [Aurantiacibacter luteus]KLE34945.1 hypothetical protein AAW00_00040 [Aurantiacibacter luteus]
MRFWREEKVGRHEVVIWVYLLAVVGGIVAIQSDAFGWHRADGWPDGSAAAPREQRGFALAPAQLAADAGTAEPITTADPSTLGDAIEAELPVPGDAPVAATGTRAPPLPRAQLLADGREVIRTDFDLGSATLARVGLEVRKPMTIDGRGVGEVAITINDASRLYISATDLRRVLPGDLAARVVDGDRFVAFDALRQSGIVIRYDPVSDVLQVST